MRRRAFLATLGALVAAPAVVRASSLMRVRPIEAEIVVTHFPTRFGPVWGDVVDVKVHRLANEPYAIIIAADGGADLLKLGSVVEDGVELRSGKIMRFGGFEFGPAGAGALLAPKGRACSSK